MFFCVKTHLLAVIKAITLVGCCPDVDLMTSQRFRAEWCSRWLVHEVNGRAVHGNKRTQQGVEFAASCLRFLGFT
eukprot:5298316-Amphidinium_carterae.1